MKITYMIKMMMPKPLTFENILLKFIYRIEYVLSYLTTPMNQKIIIGILSVPILIKMPLAISMRDL
uniref:ABC transporter permease n=1 Tax=candidate division WOR-3 bacterium TaxID=2052148 RepID=A0A7V0Z5C7_UNCW3